jgi:hypothetical protein
MATPLTNAFLSVFTTSAIDLSDKVRSISPTYTREMLDETAMGSSARRNRAGLKVVSLDVEFNWDSTLDALLWSRIEATSGSAIVFRADKAAKSGTNPEYTFTGVVESYPVMGQAVGDLHTASVTILNQGAAGLARSTS